MQEVQATFRRNGAFQCRLDESLDQPGLFHLEYLVSYMGRTSSPEQANDRRRDANIWYGVEPALRRVGTDHTPFSFDPENHATARIRPFRSDLCGHLQLVEPEFDNYQPPAAS